jgi:hypothetical protein
MSNLVNFNEIIWKLKEGQQNKTWTWNIDKYTRSHSSPHNKHKNNVQQEHYLFVTINGIHVLVVTFFLFSIEDVLLFSYFYISFFGENDRLFLI